MCALAWSDADHEYPTGTHRMIRVAHLVNIDVGVRIHLKNQLLYLQDQGYDVTASGPTSRHVYPPRQI